METTLDSRGKVQHGILSFDDLVELGLTSDAIQRRIKSGELIRIYHSVYRLRGAPPSWEQRLWAAKKWAGDGVVFSHRSGSLLHRLAGASEYVVEITSPRKLRSPSRRLLVHWSRRDPLPGAQEVAGLPVCSVPRTLLDLAAVGRPWHVEVALDHALSHNLLTVPAMWDELKLSGGRGRKGSALVRRLLEQRSDGKARSHSDLEIKLDKLLRESPVLPYFRQFEVLTWCGIPADVDFAWPEAKLAVEADGYKWHSGRQQWQNDMARQNALAEVGWLVLRFSWGDVTRRPQYVIETILTTYAIRVAAN